MEELKKNGKDGLINPMEGISVFVGMEGKGEMEIKFHCPPPPPMAMNAPLPSRRQGSKRACNLIVSSHPRVPNYMIGRDRGDE
jgi:hypothetical protein